MRRILVLCCALFLGAMPAAANEPLAPSLRSEDVFFHCSGDTKLANATYLQNGSIPAWDTTAPTESVQDGAGCGWADNFAFRSTQAGNSAHDGAWKAPSPETWTR